MFRERTFRSSAAHRVGRWLSIFALTAAAGTWGACGRSASPTEGSLVRGGGAPTPGEGSVLEGRTVAVTHFHGAAPDMTTVFGPVNAVVGPGVELRDFGATFFVVGQPVRGFVDIDLSDTGVEITATRDQPRGYFETLRFSDADGTIPPFRGISVRPATNWEGFGPRDVFVADEYIQVELTALRGAPGQRIALEITVDSARR